MNNSNPGFASMLPVRWAAYEVIWNYEKQHPHAKAGEVAKKLNINLNIVNGSRQVKKRIKAK